MMHLLAGPRLFPGAHYVLLTLTTHVTAPMPQWASKLRVLLSLRVKQTALEPALLPAHWVRQQHRWRFVASSIRRGAAGVTFPSADTPTSAVCVMLPTLLPSVWTSVRILVTVPLCPADRVTRSSPPKVGKHGHPGSGLCCRLTSVAVYLYSLCCCMLGLMCFTLLMLLHCKRGCMS